MTIEEALDIALNHHRAGRMNEAEHIYREVLALMPGNLTALNLLGAIEQTRGHHAQAAELLHQVVQAAPNDVAALNNYGQVLRSLGRSDEALACLRRAVEVNPSDPTVQLNLGTLLVDREEPAAAAVHFRATIRTRPNDAVARTNLGFALLLSGALEEAFAELQLALRLAPNLAAARNNLAALLRHIDRPDEAMVEAKRALQLVPNDPHVLNTVAACYYDLGQARETVAYAQRAIDCAPQLPMSHRHKGMALLALGDFANGWPEYEWRGAPLMPKLPKQPASPPLWDGSPLNGRSLLVIAEQGLGDAIFMVRYAAMLAAEPYRARVLLGCSQPLLKLLRTAPGVHEIYSNPEHLPHVDVQIPLMSLPGRLGTTPQTIPSQVPYLQADPQLAGQWRAKILAADPASRLRVGLTWASGMSANDSRRRTMALDTLAPLAAVEGATFFSLQKDGAAKQAAHPPAGMKLLDFTDDLHDFSDTAAMIETLDLVITVDTAACHLAGALAKSTWTMIPFVSDWRWLQGRTDTPWYPTMRLFRQTSRGDWSSVVTPIAKKLQALADEKK